MSTLISRSPAELDLRRPGAAAVVGAITFVVAMVSGEVFELNAGSGGVDTSAGELALYAAMIAVAAGIAVWLGARALSGPPSRLAATAVGLSVGSLLTVLAFWSGWAHVLAAVGALLAVEHRRRVGSFSAGMVISAVVAAVAFLAATLLCLFG